MPTNYAARSVAYPACLDLSRQTAEAGRSSATRSLAATMFHAYPGATFRRWILVVLAVLQTLAGRF